MEESRQMIGHVIRRNEGISLVFGAAGTGKTLLLRLLRQSLESEYTAALVTNGHLETPKDLFQQLLHDLHLPYSNGETIELRLQLLDFARQEPTAGIVLLFDEAQYLSPAALDEIRLLTDSADGAVPFFRTVLAGTMDFDEKLTHPNLDGFNQRIASRCYLDSLSSEETIKYITWQTDDLRIDSPHRSSSPLFTTGAKRRVHQLTDGIPRLINQLCGTALQFAAEEESEDVDETTVNAAWASLQHIEADESEDTDLDAVQEPVISSEQIKEIVARKKETFQFHQFDSVEFGTLDDPEAVFVEPKPILSFPSVNENSYKPAYPEDEEESEISDSFDLNEEEAILRHPLPLCPIEPINEVSDKIADEPADEDVIKLTLPVRKLILNYYRYHQKFWRRYLLQKIQHRLGMFVGFFQPKESEPTETMCYADDPDMNAKSLQEYGAAVLEGRPPFIRKEPNYAYQTTDSAPEDVRHGVEYPDPQTGGLVRLNWLPTEQEPGRIGISYSAFLKQKEEFVSVTKKDSVSGKPVLPMKPEPVFPVVHTSLNASKDDCFVYRRNGLDETFDETQRIDSSAISLAELFRTNSSALQKIGESPEFKGLDDAVQRQLEMVIRRITRAAEKIERAAEVSEQAGRHVSQAAEFVETEVKSALPTYLDLFKELSEFQRMISAELETVHRRNDEPHFRTFPRRQIVIERKLAAIDVDSLFR